MESEWKVVATGSSEGWSYTVEIQKRNDQFFGRITPGNQSFRYLDGGFNSQDEVVSAAKVLAEGAIREIRDAEGYRPE